MIKKLMSFKTDDNSDINYKNIPIDAIKKISIKSLKIKKSRCAVFVPLDDIQNDYCGCGLHASEHDKRLLEHMEKKLEKKPKKWDPNTCTVEDLDTDAYGDIRFRNYETTSKFIRVGHKTEIDKIISVLFKIWKLDQPKLLISVTGGAGSFSLKSKLKNAFRRGLVQAALSTDAWITSGGMNIGVMKYVGEAITSSSLDPNKKLVVLGIANWCTISNRNTLIRTGVDENQIFDYVNSIQSNIKNTPLDPNHSHFILVDNSQLNMYGGEVELRSKLEKAIVNYDNSKKAQIVVLVLEGGPNTLSTVSNSVMNGTPCVFIEGSGGCADFLAYALSKLNENNDLNENFKNDLKYRAKLLWPGKESYKIIEELQQILKHPHLLSVFRLDSNSKQNEVDVAILRALLKAESVQQESLEGSVSQLKLALTWNRIDIARDYIFTDDKYWNNESLNDVMYLAIANDKPDFVEILLENECDINEFLTYRLLLKLYNNMSKTCLLYKNLVKKKRIKKKTFDSSNAVFKFKEIGNEIEDLTDDLFKHNFTQAPLSTIKTDQVIEILRNTNEITSALVASKIFKEYDNFVAEEDESYIEIADEYEQMAVDVIQSCYEEDQEDAQRILLRHIPEYGNSNALLIGSSFENKNFVSTSCFQLLLAKIWRGPIYSDASIFTVLISIFIPIFAPLLLDLNFDKYRLNLEAMNDEVENETRNTNSKSTMNGGEKESSLRYPEKIYYFLRSPFIKFIYNQLFFIIFLGLFSYVILCDFYPIQQKNDDGVEFGQMISWQEFLLIGWVFVFTLDEIRQLIYIHRYREITPTKFFSDLWNIVELGSILLFTIGIVLRFFPKIEVYLAARIILSIDVLFWFFRAMHGYSVFRSLGPKLVMIRRMLNELRVFVLIVVVFIFAYGVSTQSLMYHNQELDLSLLKNVFFPAYFVIGGEYFEREKLMDDCEVNSTDTILSDMYSQEDCPEKYGTKVSLGLLVVYIIMLNILLVNLLIAIFSNTYEDVESEADKIWKFQRYQLVNQYFHRSFLPVPFTVFHYIYEIFRKIFRFIFGLCLNLKPSRNISFWSPVLFQSDANRLKLWESFIAEEYINNKVSKDKDSLEFKIQTNAEKIDILAQNFIKMGDSIKKIEHKLDSFLKPNIHDSIKIDPSDEMKKESKSISSAYSIKTADYYPNSNIEKIPVPLEKKSWSINYDNYNPNEYTSYEVLYGLSSDIELLNKKDSLRLQISFNKYDKDSGIDRTSCLGKYLVKDNVPLNPKGRQGISGRGSLKYWGPNHLYEIIFTRYKLNKRGENVFDSNGKCILEFLAIEKKNSRLRFPSVVQEKNMDVIDLVERDIIDDIFDIKNVEISAIKSILKNPINVTRYYKESKFNTDNAWLEFSIVNFHDEANKIFSKLTLKDKFEEDEIAWNEINEENISLLSKEDSSNLMRVLILHQFSIERL